YVPFTVRSCLSPSTPPPTNTLSPYTTLFRSRREGHAQRRRHLATLEATRDGDPRGREVVAGVPEGRPAARGRAPGDRRAQRPRGDGRAHAVAGGELRPALERRHAHGGAARGGRSRPQPRVRCRDEARPDAGGRAGA